MTLSSTIFQLITGPPLSAIILPLKLISNTIHKLMEAIDETPALDPIAESTTAIAESTTALTQLKVVDEKFQGDVLLCLY